MKDVKNCFNCTQFSHCKNFKNSDERDNYCSDYHLYLSDRKSYLEEQERYYYDIAKKGDPDWRLAYGGY